MNAYLIPGLLGLLVGLVLHWGQLSRADGLRAALGLRHSLPLRTGLTALGWGVLLTALLMWLAVIDVDTVDVLPLSMGTLLGGALLGVCAGLCGFTPTTAFAALGGGHALEALCVIAGCFAGTALSPVLDGLLAPLHTPWVDATLFKVTLDEPFLLSSGSLGLGCLGALLAVWGMCIPSPRVVIVPDETIAERAAEAEEPAEPPHHEESGQAEPPPEALTPDAQPPAEDAPDPDSATSETVVAMLEGEEPLIVDTALDEANDQSAEPEAADESAESDEPEASDKPED